MTRNAWFQLVKSIDPWFSRKSDNELVLTFEGYKCSNYFDAQEALRAVGGAFMSVQFDTHCGKTFVVVREPRALAP